MKCDNDNEERDDEITPEEWEEYTSEDANEDPPIVGWGVRKHVWGTAF